VTCGATCIDIVDVVIRKEGVSSRFVGNAFQNFIRSLGRCVVGSFCLCVVVMLRRVVVV